MKRKPRHIGHKIALVCAGMCVFFGVVAFAAFSWVWLQRGMADTWTPSLLATVAFFGCCAGVLYATSIPQPVLPAEGDFTVDT
ncbi:MAG: hypothetical protein LWW81_01395 [Rhodocyclales bacterium]|nr:hypothetical protein [Rhodocyclales bacterium]